MFVLYTNSYAEEHSNVNVFPSYDSVSIQQYTFRKIRYELSANAIQAFADSVQMNPIVVGSDNPNWYVNINIIEEIGMHPDLIGIFEFVKKTLLPKSKQMQRPPVDDELDICYTFKLFNNGVPCDSMEFFYPCDGSYVFPCTYSMIMRLERISQFYNQKIDLYLNYRFKISPTTKRYYQDICAGTIDFEMK